MPLRGALVGWQGSSRQNGVSATRISLSKYPENFEEGIYWGLQQAGLDFGDYARIRAGIGFPRFPVGPSIDRRDIQLPPSRSLPALVPTSLGGPPQAIFREDPRGSFPQITEVLPVQAPIPIPALPQVRTGPSTEVGGPDSTSIHTGVANMPDLGDWLGAIGEAIPGPDFFDLGSSVLGWGGPVSSTPVATPTVSQPPVAQPPNTPSYQGGTFGGGCESDPRNQYVMKFICGQWKWVKKRKRRSKRLANASDIKDLSSLMGVLGNGKNLTTWIATHR